MTSENPPVRKPFFSPRFWPAAAALWTAAVIALALSPQVESGWLMKTFGDKVLHAVAFAVGAVTWINTIGASGRVRQSTALLWGAVVALFFGALVEHLQGYVPLRQADIRDFFADAAGVLLAVAYFAVISAVRRRPA